MAKHQRLSASGKLERNPERFYCPYPNCTRSFAELWRLKVYYRVLQDRPVQTQQAKFSMSKQPVNWAQIFSGGITTNLTAEKRQTQQSVDKQQLT